jgi:recombinational DNA repair protein RecT
MKTIIAMMLITVLVISVSMTPALAKKHKVVEQHTIDLDTNANDGNRSTTYTNAHTIGSEVRTIVQGIVNGLSGN